MHRCFSLVFVAGFIIQVQSQDIKVGVKAGYNRVSVHRVAQVNLLRTPEPLESRNSFHAGLATSIGMTDVFGLLIEPSFIRKGSIRGQEASEWLSYLEIPVLIAVRPWKHLQIEAGPSAGFLLDAQVKTDAGTSAKIVSNKREVSMIIGSSWDITQHINLGARYARSLTAVSEIQFTNDSGFITDEFDEFNQYVELFARFYLLSK